MEPESYLRGLAQVAAAQAPAPVRVVDGTADTLLVPDASMDAAVASLVLCSLPDQARALAEVFRVLRPGGELCFFEHVQADTAGLARVQRLADRIWPTLVGGCHTNRYTLAAITAVGSRSPASSGSASPKAGAPASRAPRPRRGHRSTSPQAEDGPQP